MRTQSTLCVYTLGSTMSLLKTYSEMIELPTFEKRYEYLKLDGAVGQDTFGAKRWLNQVFYRSYEWRKLRQEIILRDNGCDLGIDDRIIFGKILIHHINPITMDDINGRKHILFDPENLVCVSHNTHEAIHYGSFDLLVSSTPVVRKPGDTCPWLK